mmetsp:Transcript_29643/g.85872  ORF Transcript_29643/g.85872 Transcript_29643/m.85872 type:complete len:340 (+) Transcript_29643:1182-2201(+)
MSECHSRRSQSDAKAAHPSIHPPASLPPSIHPSWLDTALQADRDGLVPRFDGWMRWMHPIQTCTQDIHVHLPACLPVHTNQSGSIARSPHGWMDAVCVSVCLSVYFMRAKTDCLGRSLGRNEGPRTDSCSRKSPPLGPRSSSSLLCRLPGCALWSTTATLISLVMTPRLPLALNVVLFSLEAASSASPLRRKPTIAVTIGPLSSLTNTTSPTLAKASMTMSLVVSLGRFRTNTWLVASIPRPPPPALSKYRSWSHLSLLLPPTPTPISRSMPPLLSRSRSRSRGLLKTARGAEYGPMTLRARAGRTGPLMKTSLVLRPPPLPSVSIRSNTLPPAFSART